MNRVHHSVRSLLLLVLALLLDSSPALAASISIWPINPEIAPDQGSTALWIENRGETPTVLQLRIFAWRQENGADVYDNQNAVVGSPPIMEIAPGARQYIRVLQQTAAPTAAEQSYRIVVDEIPAQLEPVAAAPAGVGLNLRLRYSLPLFSPGIATHADTDAAAAGKLSFRVIEAAGGRLLAVRNAGTRHAQLKRVAYRHGADAGMLAESLYGYVLAGSERHWQLPEDVSGIENLIATVNGIEDSVIAAGSP